MTGSATECTALKCNLGDRDQVCPAIGDLDKHGVLASSVLAMRDNHAAQHLVETTGGLVALQNPEGTTMDSIFHKALRHHAHQRAPHAAMLRPAQDVDRLELTGEACLCQPRRAL